MQLQELNQQISDVLLNLKKIPAENELTDILVLNLQALVSERQFLVDNLLKGDVTLDEKFLLQQLELTNQLCLLAQEIMTERKNLLVLTSKNQRKINVYQTIDANR
ncbi:hypothetical protein [Shewanella sp. HN-41]|uniref:hypothetical protein n=1 Tax=Shewanella sp. HN-41 TaxID=327275 RepID=UPI0002126074|nr:hypothetical protein [Shewanella sp. HN-41]EGM69295.1 hypothetical protein SOHN41_02751 [Shewanella sp. HN-41]